MVLEGDRGAVDVDVAVSRSPCMAHLGWDSRTRGFVTVLVWKAFDTGTGS